MNTNPTEQAPPKPRRIVWWVELLNDLITPGAVLAVYVLAGGTTAKITRSIPEQIEHPGRATVAALVTLLAVAVTGLINDLQGRISQARADRWRAWQLRNGTPACIGPGRRAGQGEAVVPAQRQDGPVPDGGSRAMVERAVRLCGPISWNQLRDRLATGGVWGPPLPISSVAMGKLLKQPSTNEPVEWLAPRGRGELYDHVENVRARQEAGR